MHESWCCAKPPTLNKWPQEGQGTRGCKRNDCIIDVRGALSGCGKRDRKGADKPKEGERTGWGELGRMGLMGD
jgi:hypothetical protein